MKVLFFGIYNKDDVVNARTRILLRGLKQQGIEVTECLSPVPSIKRFWILFKNYLRVDKNYDLMFVPYGGGQMVMPLAKLLSRKKIVVDPIVSLYDTMIFDRKKYKKKSFRAVYYYLLDWLTGKFADIIIFDTNANIDYFAKTFNVPKNKFRRLFIGSDETVMFPQAQISEKKNESFVVHFHGFFIPLQGIENIIKSAKILEKENIVFNLIGKGQTYKEMRNLAEELNLRNVNFIDSVPYKELPKYISIADVCLGVFGVTNKALRVIPNKIYDAIAMGKPIITADTPAIGELLEDRENVLLSKAGDPVDLAKKIMELKNNPVLLRNIADNGQNLFKEKLREEIISKEFINILNLSR